MQIVYLEHHRHRAFRLGNAALKKQEGGVAGEKTRGGEKKLKAPGRVVPEIRKEVSRVKGESKREVEEENKGKEKEVNKDKGSGEESEPKDVVEEKPEHTTEVHERVEGDDGEEEVEADEQELPDGVHDVDAYCDNREPHVSRPLISRRLYL